MMIADEQLQQDDQSDPVMVLGEDFQPSPVVNVDVSEDLLAAHISRDKKTFFRFQCESKIARYGHLLILVQAAT